MAFAFLAQILSLLLPISVDKLAGMLPNCDCLPYSQAGGAQQNIVLERGMLTAVSSIKPVNQCNKFSVFIAFADTLSISTHFGQNWYPRCEGRAFTGPASKLRRPKRVSGETLNLLC